MAAAPPATPRHPNHPLPLLPSGPGGVCGLSSRGDRRGHHGRARLGRGSLLATGGEGGMVRPVLGLTLRCAKGQPAAVQIRSRRICRTARALTRPLFRDFQLLRQIPFRRVAQSTGGEGGIRTRDTGISRIHTFQACSFNHSDTSPHAKPLSHHSAPGGMVRLVLSLTPHYRSGPACGCPNSFLRICRTRDTGISRIHTFQACSFNHSDTSPHASTGIDPPG